MSQKTRTLKEMKPVRADICTIRVSDVSSMTAEYGGVSAGATRNAPIRMTENATAASV